MRLQIPQPIHTNVWCPVLKRRSSSRTQRATVPHPSGFPMYPMRRRAGLKRAFRTRCQPISGILRLIDGRTRWGAEQNPSRRSSRQNLYALSPEEDRKMATVCSSLEQALDCLDQDREFLTRGGVFNDDLIDGYIEMKRAEVTRLRATTHPIEFEMYYSL